MTVRAQVDQNIGPVFRSARATIVVKLTGTLQKVAEAVHGRDLALRHVSACETGGAVAALTVHLVPEGGTATTENAVCMAMPLTANESTRIDALSGDFGPILAPGGAIWAKCSGAVNLSISTEDVAGAYGQ